MGRVDLTYVSRLYGYITRTWGVEMGGGFPSHRNLHKANRVYDRTSGSGFKFREDVTN